MAKSSGIVWLGGLAALWLLGCGKLCLDPASCQTDNLCGLPVNAHARDCELTALAFDPDRGECIPYDKCHPVTVLASWARCDNPCTNLGESSCGADTRCQPIYVSADIAPDSCLRKSWQSENIACALPAARPVPPLPSADGFVTAAGVNQGDRPKRDSWNNSCNALAGRTFFSCRAVAPDPYDPPCSGPLAAQCQAKQQAECNRVLEDGCLTRPDCQPVGTRCYCPPGAACECSGGYFLGCEANYRLRHCSSSTDCGAGERCDNDEDCLKPRSYLVQPQKPAGPGAPGCQGACVPVGCAGMGEQQCNATADCDGGSYSTTPECAPRPYYGSIDATACAPTFVSCAAPAPLPDFRLEPSLLVREPAIIDDPEFALESVLTRLAPAGQVDALTRSLLSQLGSGQQVASGAITKTRRGFTKLYQKLDDGTAGLTQRFAARMVTTALINRLDLATVSSCGEARLAFAMTSAYGDGNQRMTLIVELRVPDDGDGCRSVAQRWAALSHLDSVAAQRSALIALYAELLRPENLGQIRTNEFVNLNGNEAWELREFHRRASDALLELAPVAQTLNPLQLDNPALLTWLVGNAAALQAGTAIIPSQFLAGASSEDGGRLDLTRVTTMAPDLPMLPLDAALNGLTCAGCHLTETRSAFVHIGERLAHKVDGVYRPGGRAVIDGFLQKELIKRAAVLRSALSGLQRAAGGDWRPITQARVH